MQPESSARPRVLVVDDDVEVRGLLGRRLRRLGYVVGEAADGVEALALVETAIPDVVITDMSMPKLDGAGLLEALRRVDPELPVIVLTGYGSLDNAIQAIRKGTLFDYLLKPLPEIALLDLAVRRALDVRELRARAREADQVRAMRELAVTASDRILNPLNAIALSLPTLCNGAVSREARDRVVTTVERAIDTIAKVVRRMRTVARYVPRDVTRGLREIDIEEAAADESQAT
jgi:DNA-binding NtrC family response regulator